MSRTALTLTATVIALAAGRVAAQPLPYGQPTGFMCDVQAATGNAGCLGVCRTVDAAGVVNYWVSARALPAAAGNPHLLYRFDAGCNLIGMFPQPTMYGAGNTWGIRDLAWNGGDLIYGGHELAVTGNTIWAFRISLLAWDPAASVVVGPGAPATIRALAYRPGMPGGIFPQLFTSDFGGAGAVINVATGAVLPFPATGGTSVYGAGFDPTTDRVFWFGQGGDQNPGAVVQVVITDFDAAALGPDGNVCYADRSIPGGNPGGIAGGAEVYVTPGGFPEMVCLHQAGSDTIATVSVTLGSGPTVTAGGACRPFACVGLGPAFIDMFPNQPAYAGNAAWGIDIDNYATPPVPPGSNLILLASIGPFPPLPLPPPMVPGSNLLIDPAVLMSVGPMPLAAAAPTMVGIPIPAGIPDGATIWFQGVLFGPPGWTTQRTGIRIYNP